MFQEIILPVFRSTRLCYSLWYDAPTMLPPVAWKRRQVTCKVRFQATDRQHRGCIIPQTVTHSLVHLKMGKIIARNMLRWLELLINRYCCIWLVVYIIYINDARSSKYQIYRKLTPLRPCIMM